MDLSSTLSNTSSKQTILEESSITFASLEEAKKRKNDAISNERIQNGDIILKTYEVTSDAISGGMGSVWRVHHQSWNTDLAMKRPQPRFFAEGSEKRKEQFIAECENWINLGLHPNIVSCYYVREIGGVPTIFSEWMDNGSLKDRIADGSLYEGTEQEVQERILDIAIQTARGLQYSHENGLIHQDMKPGNLLLSKEWDAKVADFGLAKAKEQLDDKSDTAKTTGYTLAYCPAEQANGDKPEKWMDVYAWALTVLEMYAGKRLWDTGAEAKEHFDKYPSECEYSIPPGMKSLLRSCLTEKQNSFAKTEEDLLSVYRVMMEHDYPRKPFSGVTQSAEFLNNKALSFLDLKMPEEAEKCWQLALENNSGHMDSIYNEIVFRWNNAQIDDLEALKRIRSADDGSVKAMMYQLRIQIARADVEAHRCVEILRNDRGIKPGSPEEKELDELAEICDSACKEDEKSNFWSKPPVIADENGNLGYVDNKSETRTLVFKNKEGRIIEQYSADQDIISGFFDPTYKRIAVICSWEKPLIFKRGINRPEAIGDEAEEIVKECLDELRCGIHECVDIVSYDSDTVCKLNLAPEKATYRWDGHAYEKIPRTKSDGYHYQKFGLGDVIYVLRPQGVILRTLKMPSENKQDIHSVKDTRTRI